MNDQGRVALVTGGSRRIGAQIVRTLHESGFRILLHYRHSGPEAKALAESLNALRQDSVVCLQADLGRTAALPELVKQAAGTWGRLDALINNASAFHSTPVGTVTEAQWDELLASNLKAPFFLAQAAAGELRLRRGAIINIIDVYGERPLLNFPVYSITKAGLAALTQSLAIELAPDIRVNGVSPGAILWPEGDDGDGDQAAILARIPLGQPGAPPDIARAVRFFLNDAPYVTGQILSVDGGRRLFI